MRYIGTIFILTFLLASQVKAVGISVEPSSVNLETSRGEDKKISLKVKNPSSEVAIFRISLDEFSKQANISPTSLTLESQEEKEISIVFTPESDGQLLTNISITAQPLSNQTFQAGAGVKIPLSITVKPKANPQIFSRLEFYIAVFDFLLLIFLVNLIIKHKRKHQLAN
jgi:hypothetical protein